MSFLRKREVPMAAFAITFLLACFGNYLDVPGLSTAYTSLFDWILIMTTFALGTGVISLVLYHSNKITRKSKGYPMSFVVFASIVLMAVACFLSEEARGYWYGEIYTSLSIAVLGFTSFTQYTALYRAFRVRNIDALVFSVAAGILIMLYAPIFELWWPASATIGSWILEVPGMGANRGIIIGVAVGTIALAIRTLIGKERPYGA